MLVDNGDPNLNSAPITVRAVEIGSGNQDQNEVPTFNQNGGSFSPTNDPDLPAFPSETDDLKAATFAAHPTTSEMFSANHSQ